MHVLLVMHALCNIIFKATLFILECNSSIIGNKKSITRKNFSVISYVLFFIIWDS